jgi:hypothetical protein
MTCVRPGEMPEAEEDFVSRFALIVASVAVGLILALGAAFTAGAVFGPPAVPANRQLDNYGSP